MSLKTDAMWHHYCLITNGWIELDDREACEHCKSESFRAPEARAEGQSPAERSGDHSPATDATSAAGNASVASTPAPDRT